MSNVISLDEYRKKKNTDENRFYIDARDDDSLTFLMDIFESNPTLFEELEELYEPQSHLTLVISNDDSDNQRTRI